LDAKAEMTTPRSSGSIKTSPALKVVTINAAAKTVMMIALPFLTFVPREACMVTMTMDAMTATHSIADNPAIRSVILIYSPFLFTV
jgi:hypothetical protein